MKPMEETEKSEEEEQLKTEKGEIQNQKPQLKQEIKDGCLRAHELASRFSIGKFLKTCKFLLKNFEEMKGQGQHLVLAEKGWYLQ